MELNIVQFFNQLGAGGVVDDISKFISKVLVVTILWVILAVLALILDKKNGKWVFLTIIAALVLHFAISEGIFKHFITLFWERTRPYLAHPDVITPVGTGKDLFVDSSFPSSHMASSLAVLTVFFIYYRWTWVPSLLFILLMAFSRMHNGMHYPSDVLAGTILGIIYAIIAYQIVKSIRERKGKAGVVPPAQTPTLTETKPPENESQPVPSQSI